MIIIGYQGIGKSTLAGKENKYIDLESSNFWVDGKRGDNWHIVYANIAEHLSKQGYVVFTSSHQVVRDALRNSTEHVVVAFPHTDLKSKWLEKLEDRYSRTGLEKDFKALANAKDRYTENIEELALDCFILGNFDALVIDEIDYDLKGLIELIGK